MKNIYIIIIGSAFTPFISTDIYTPFMEEIVDLHNFIFFYLILILLFVVSPLVSIIYHFYVRGYHLANSRDISLRSEMLLGSKILQGTVLEIVWTLILNAASAVNNAYKLKKQHE